MPKTIRGDITSWVVTLFFLSDSLHSLAQSEVLDKGIGILFLLQSNPTNENAVADTVAILESKEPLAPVLCKLHFNPRNRFDLFIGGEYSKSAIEFDYETFGLPVLSIDGGSAWFEVLLSNHGRYSSGFIRFDKTRLGFNSWSDLLPRHPLFFENERNVRFYKSPKGNDSAVGIPLKSTYIMWPIETKGSWLKVKVVTPSDHCDQVEDKQVWIYWIRYLDERRRPLVWYFARGC